MLKDFRSVKDVWDKMQYILTAKQKKRSVAVFVLIMFGAIFETLGVSAIIPLVQAMVSADELLVNPSFSFLVNTLKITTEKQLIAMISVVVILLYIIKNLYLVGLSLVRVKFAVSIKRELSVRIMRSYMKRNYSYFINMKTADIIRGVGYDCSGVYEVIYNVFRLLTDIVTVICICVFIFCTDFFMACGVTLLLGISLLFLISVFRKRMKRLGDESRVYTSGSNRFLYEAFQGVKDVFIFKGRGYYADQYDKYYSKQQEIDAYRTVAAESPAYFIEAVCITGLIFVVCLKVLTGTDANTFIPQLAAFAVAAFRVLPSIGKISSSYNHFVFMCPTVTAVYNNLKEVALYEQQLMGVEINESMESALPFTGSIEFKDITWRYPNSEVEVLSTLNLEIAKGTSIGLIGHSGSGKSTLADILLGLLIPQTGVITVDGINIFEHLDEWRNTISYVPQTVFLRDDTIRNNVAFGLEESEIDDTKIWNALEKAQLSEIVRELPEGIHTHMGERGIRFSGGQKQRVAIARALYNDPEILVLDEATAALDGETESAVMEAIDALHGHKTLVIVAHRLTTIRKCDKIYEIVDGHAVERRKEGVLRGESYQDGMDKV